ncbi:uncharacterized protein LOC117818761 [Notolabrus celidotus]|uniref:uncharacterized protein LOC117818761 n=1 Tax=Notolabrus celidotus TaxID=1203425 RepID=UPI00148F6B6E|nr:uncharacterized protein LOC117818761 [Notolabrus celidotus]
MEAAETVSLSWVGCMQCKFCKFTSSSQETLLKHCRLRSWKWCTLALYSYRLYFSGISSDHQQRSLGDLQSIPDMYVPCLLRLYQAKREACGRKMEDLLDTLDEQTSDILSHRKTAAMKGLPIFVRDDATTFFLQCSATEPEDRALSGVSVAILTTIEDDDAPNVLDVAVVLEGAIVLHDMPDLCTAFAYLFGLLYAMNIDYPKQMAYTFEAIQTIFFELGSVHSQRTRSLKTKLSL